MSAHNSPTCAIRMNFPDLIDPSNFGIHYFLEDVIIEIDEAVLTNWIKNTLEEEGKHLQSIRFIFCTDVYLHQINVAYLDHDTLTDVITFPYAENEEVIDGEIYISVDRIKENAKKYKVEYKQELHRIMIHGVLHLCGYDDKERNSKKKMSKLEDYYLKNLIL